MAEQGPQITGRFDAFGMAEQLVPLMDRMEFPVDLDGAPVVCAKLDLLADDTAGTAIIKIGRVPRDEDGGYDLSSGKMVPLEIGHYSPGKGWLLYSELFSSRRQQIAALDEIQALEETERARLSSVVPDGSRFVDLHDKRTVEARQYVSDFLKKHGLANRLIQHARHNSDTQSRYRSADRYTTTSVFSHGVDNPPVFGVRWKGLKLDRDPYNTMGMPKPGTLRSNHEVEVVSPAGGSWSWAERDKRTRAYVDLGLFNELFTDLNGFADKYPDFSKDACAIAYNDWNK